MASAADTALVGSLPSNPCSHSGIAILVDSVLLLLLRIFTLQPVLCGVLATVLDLLLDSLCVVQPEVEVEVEVEVEMTVLSS